MKTMNTTRRGFLKVTGGAAVTASFFPGVITGSKSGSAPAVVGEGDFRYACRHGWGELPGHIQWTDTHGVAIDGEGLIYVKHRGGGDTPMDTIVVFDTAGKYVRSFGKEYFGGGHGIDVRREGNQEFLYLSDTKGKVAKTTLTGEQVWVKTAPNATGYYNAAAPGQGRFSPTNIAFRPDGGYYVADGYGSNYIHEYDKDDRWVRSWGGTGMRPGLMRTPHSIWLDDRQGRELQLVVADRANARLQYFTLEGRHAGFVDAVSFPADFDVRGDVLLVPDLHARVTLFDLENRVIAHLGYDPAWTERALGNNFEMRGRPDLWEDGRFIHPHDACFDRDGNIYVAEWVASGRVSFLERLS